MAKLRPLGDILLDIEPFLIELVESHNLQHGDVYGLLNVYLETHLPGYKEEYLDGTHPVFRYGYEEKSDKKA